MKSVWKVKFVGGAVSGTAAVLLLGCSNLPNRPGTSQISSDRTVEYLDLTPGEIPQWRKQGEISLPIDGEE